MSTTRDLAASDAIDIIESEGTPFTLIYEGEEILVIGILGDIGSLLDPVSGTPIQGRSIESTVIAGKIIAAAGKPPARGWKAHVTGFDGRAMILYVRRSEYDRTVGLCRLTLGLDLEDSDDGE